MNKVTLLGVISCSGSMRLSQTVWKLRFETNGTDGFYLMYLVQKCLDHSSLIIVVKRLAILVVILCL